MKRRMVLISCWNLFGKPPETTFSLVRNSPEQRCCVQSGTKNRGRNVDQIPAIRTMPSEKLSLC